MPLPTSNAPTGLRARIAALTPRERGFLAAGAAAVLVFLIYLAWPASDEEQVELAASPSAPVQPSFVPPPTPPAPAPMPVVVTPPPPDPAAAASLVLRGVMGGGPSGGAAIVGSADGGQRVVRVGREVAPGITLRQVGVNYAIVTTGSGDLRLELNKPGGTQVSSPGPTAAPAPARRETTEFRLGLQPVRRNGRVSGYALKPGDIPARLQQAGLRAGDVILRVNGSELDEERLAELSWELSNAERTEFEFVRNGQPMKAQFQAR